MMRRMNWIWKKIADYSKLKDLIQSAVATATKPLHQKMKSLADKSTKKSQKNSQSRGTLAPSLKKSNSKPSKDDNNKVYNKKGKPKSGNGNGAAAKSKGIAYASNSTRKNFKNKPKKGKKPSFPKKNSEGRGK